VVVAGCGTENRPVMPGTGHDFTNSLITKTVDFNSQKGHLFVNRKSASVFRHEYRFVCGFTK